MNTANDVSDSVTFHVNRDENGNIPEWVGEWKVKIGEFPNAEDFRGVHIIYIENTADGNLMQNCYGIDIALGILRKDPEAKIVLYHVLKLAFIQKKNVRTDLVLSYPNVRILEMPFAEGAFENVFQTKTQIEATPTYGISEEVRVNISHLAHDLKYVTNRTNPEGRELEKFTAFLETVRGFFPTLAHASSEEVFEFVDMVIASRPEVMKGQYVEGVHCDIGGTLLINDEVNQYVLKVLKEYETLGKPITLWTDGNVDLTQQQLDQFGITYRLCSKMDFAGATVEVVIENEDQFTFTARTKISAKTFVWIQHNGKV